MRSTLERIGHEATRAVRGRLDDHHHRLPALRVRSGRAAAKVWFLVPDWSRPSGGLQTMYRHVDLLNECGVPASVLHARPGFRLRWFANETVVSSAQAAELSPADLLVVPEVYGGDLAGLPGSLRHVVLNQSGHLTWRRDAAGARRYYQQSPALAGMVVVSEYSRALLSYAFPELRVLRVHLSVAEVFRPGPEVRPRRIAFMPRRGWPVLSVLLEVLRSRGSLRGWELIPVDGLGQAEVAEVLRSSQVFFTASEREGFGLPAAEAMACGCYVVGFHGLAGREFFRPEFCSPVQSGDVLAFAREADRVLGLGQEWRAERGAAASRFVRHEYSLGRERQDVAGCYRRLLAAAPG